MDLKKIISDSVITSVSRSVQIIRSIILIPIITKLSGEDLYGVWVISLSFIGVFTVVGSMHMHGVIIRYTSENKKAGEVAGEVLFLVIPVFLITASLLILTSFFTNFFSVFLYSSINTVIIAILSVISLSEAVYLIIRNVPRAEGRVKEYEIIEILRTILESVVMSTIFFIKADLLVALTGLFIIRGGFNFLLIINFKVIPRVPKISIIKSHLNYGLPMVPKEISQQVLNHADKFLILYFFSPSSVAVYAITYSVARFLYTFCSVVNATLYPAVTNAWDKDDDESIANLYSAILKWIVILGVPAAFGLILLSKSLIMLLSTPYIATQGATFFPILAVGFLIYGLSDTLVYILNSNEDNSKIAKITIFAVIFNLLLNIFLIPLIGVGGAAVSTSTSFIIISIYLLYHSHSLIRFELPIRTLLVSTISSCVMIIVLYSLGLTGHVRLALYPFIGALVYFYCIRLFGIAAIKDIIYVVNSFIK